MLHGFRSFKNSVNHVRHLRNRICTRGLTNKHCETSINNGVGILKFDTPGSKINALNEEFSHDCRAAFEELRDNPEVKSMVFISGKPDCFIAGADIKMLSACETKEEIMKLSAGGQEFMQQMADCKKPVVAAISGSCMGGGLEIALACHYRVALDTKKTSLALPEVMLGLLPGSGGTQRLPPLIGLPNALPMMLTGAGKNAIQAKKLGLVDLVIKSLGPGVKEPKTLSHDYLEKCAADVARQLADGSLKKPKRTKSGMKGLSHNLPLNNKFLRNYVFKQATKEVMKKTYGLYPSPLKIIDSAKHGLESPSTGYARECENFGDLAMTDESKALQSIFFGKQACEKNHYGKPARMPQNMAVLGAGLMGAGVATVSLDKFPKVILKDVSDTALSRGEDMVRDVFQKKVKRKKMSQFDCDKLMSSLHTEVDYSSFKDVDIVIEAVFEDINLKHRIIKEVEAATPDHCIFASNTSALPISDLAKASVRPENFIGMHYFSPVDKMPLLEIITTDQTSKETTAAAVEVGLKQKKTVIVVKDGPGFYTTRVIGALMGEAFACIQEGTSPTDLDKLFVKFGWPVGGATLVDEVGIDVAYKVTKYFLEVFGERISAGDPRVIEELVEAGCLGRKSGKGIFLYRSSTKGGARPVNPVAQKIMDKYKKEGQVAPNGEDVQWRTYLRSVNEAALCLQEDIIANPVDGNIGLIFGIGHCPQRGGPFQFLDTYGAQAFVDKMRGYEDSLGFRFEPAQIVLDYAKSGKKFMSG